MYSDVHSAFILRITEGSSPASTVLTVSHVYPCIGEHILNTAFRNTFEKSYRLASVYTNQADAMPDDMGGQKHPFPHRFYTNSSEVGLLHESPLSPFFNLTSTGALHWDTQPQNQPCPQTHRQGTWL